MAWDMETQKKYIDDYQKEHITRVVVKLNDLTDGDILEHLKTVGKRQTYIKKLIREDMKKRKKK